MYLDAPSKIWFYPIYFAYCNIFHEREHTFHQLQKKYACGTGWRPFVWITGA